MLRAVKTRTNLHEPWPAVEEIIPSSGVHHSPSSQAHHSSCPAFLFADRRRQSALLHLLGESTRIGRLENPHYVGPARVSTRRGPTNMAKYLIVVRVFARSCWKRNLHGV
jgi:hypothetical protein